MLKTLSKSMREYKTASLLTVVFAIVEVALEIIIPVCMSELIDNGIEKGNMTVVVKCGAALLLLAVLEVAAGFICARLGAKASSGFAGNLRMDMFDNVQSFAFSNIDKFSVSSIVTRLTTDVTNVRDAYQMIIRMAVRGPVMILFSVIVTFMINAKIAFVFLAIIPCLGLCLYLIIRKVHPMFQRVFRTYDNLNNVVQENVKGIRVVKAFNAEEQEISKFKNISQRIFKDFSGAERLMALNSPLMQFFMYGCMLFISWIGAKAIVLSGNDPDVGLTTGELTTLITYSVQILTSLMMLSMVFVMITIARSSAGRIAQILEEKSDISSPDNPIIEVKNGEIIFENVDFSYSKNAEKKTLDNVNLVINSGETIGIIGGTGSSKTTLVQLIPRLYDVSCGSVKVGGEDVRSYDLNVLRNSVAMVLQKNELFSGTVRENLLWGNENATDEEIRCACHLACADEFISSMPQEYESIIEQGGANVSGGQKQRLCIARALLKKPKILILDDSTSAVDTRTDAFIQKSLCEQIPDTTKIIIAQRVSSVINADRIVVLDDGKIESVGTHRHLLEISPIYREVYNSQYKGECDND